ncbi:MAG TPA: IS110 family transposase [Spirochaetia bacterium]|nr:IS110 family transposase [Spirochaetia bacterium]
MGCSQKIRRRKATAKFMYAALDLHEKSIQCVLKDDAGKIVRESKVPKDEERILEFLDGTHASVVMESGYNHQHISDVLKEKGYDVKVAHPLMVKAIAYAKVKTDKVDARTLADLLRADMIPESYVPDEKTREVRDLVRRRHHLVETRTAFKSKVQAEVAKRWVKHEGDVFTKEGRDFLRSLHIDAVDDYLDAIEFLDGKIGELDRKVKEVAQQDRYAKLLVTVPGISYYSGLLISSEIADVSRFSDHEHLCSYAGLVPGLRQSAERSHPTPSKTRSAMLNWIMVQCTRVHVRSCDSSITRFYTELAMRRGEKVAIVAAARKLMRATYIMLKEEKTFRLDG